MMRQRTARALPRTASARALRAWLRPFYVEARFFAHAVRSGLWRSLAPRAWVPAGTQTQHVWSWPIPVAARADAAELVSTLRRAGLRIHEGGNVFYLPPQPGLTETLGPVVHRYPPGSGFKVLRDFRGIEEAHYLHPTRQTRLRRRLIGTPRGQLVVANYLYRLGLGPRVWDLCVLRAGDLSMPAFVVAHVDGGRPDDADWARFMARLRTALAESELRTNVPYWERRRDFGCPACNGNLLRDREGAVYYVDFQNFSIRNLRRLIGPGSAGQAFERFQAVRQVLHEQAIEFDGRLVLDFREDGGAMLRHALSAGAWWGLGWAPAAVAREAEATAVALGFTRLDMIVSHPGDRHGVAATVPAWLKPLLPDAVVFSRARARSPQQLTEVMNMPWQALVYEAYAGEAVEDPARLRALERAGMHDVRRLAWPGVDGRKEVATILMRRRKERDAASGGAER